jgi:hypothetical protein
MVTTRITEFRHAGEMDTSDQFVQIGGYVLDATVDPVQPIANAWVQLESPGGTVIKTTKSNEHGQYIFDRLQPGAYQLRWRTAGKAEPAIRDIEVPSPTGEYDLIFE